MNTMLCTLVMKLYKSLTVSYSLTNYTKIMFVLPWTLFSPFIGDHREKDLSYINDINVSRPDPS